MSAGSQASSLFVTFGIDGKTLINESVEFIDGQRFGFATINGYLLDLVIREQDESAVEIEALVIKVEKEGHFILASPVMIAEWEKTAEITTANKRTSGSSIHFRNTA